MSGASGRAATRWIKAAWVVFGKEMLDASRDRRSLLSALLYPLLGPLMIVLLASFLADMEEEARTVEIPIVGVERAPALVDWLGEQGARVVEAPEAPQRAVELGEVDLVLLITDDFSSDFSQLRPATVELVVDRSRNDARASVARVTSLLREYGDEAASSRLIARGIDPELVQPIVIHEVQVASAQQVAANLLGFVPMFVIMAAFIGGMQVAADTTAGERERASLEPLLINPAPRLALVVGKCMCAGTLAMVTVSLTMASCTAALYSPSVQALGFRIELDVGLGARLLIVLLSLALLAAGMQILIASFARSYKEAQTYLALSIFVPMAPGFLGSLYPLGDESWMLMVPALGHQLLLTEALGGQGIPMASIILATGPTLVFALICVIITGRLFGRETIIFGR